MLPSPVEPIVLPPDVLERVARVFDYHQLAKLTPALLRDAPYVLDWQNFPSPHRVFESLPQVQLPRSLLRPETDTLDVLRRHADVEPSPARQDVLTLASWLQLAYGITQKRVSPHGPYYLRSCPSSGAAYPGEVYVLSLGLPGLTPGLYHFSQKGFQLRMLREGGEALARVLRGRPDLNFVKSLPAVVLVSTIFWRTAWKYRDRGYRHSVLDAGHLVENLVVAAGGLGIRTHTRLRVSDTAMRELIGVPPDAHFGDAEAVHALVAWADAADEPHPPPRPGTGASLPPIPRPPISHNPVEYAAILPTHVHCVAPGVGVTEVKPPFTELTAMPDGIERIPVAQSATPLGGDPLADVVTRRRSARDFLRESLPAAKFFEANWRAFRAGTYWPLRPDGQHVALVRPFWLVHDVAGLDSGIYHYDPVADAWSLLRQGSYRAQAKALCALQELAANAAAVCFMAANLGTLMSNTGPDAYRLAHLEAGICGQRLCLAAEALSFACTGIASFFDDDARKFLGLAQTGWEVIYAAAVGIPVMDDVVDFDPANE